MFQYTQGKRNMVKDIGKIFKKYLRKTQERRETYTPEGVDIEEDMSLIRSLRRGPTTEALNMGLYGTLVESNNRRIKMEKGNMGESGLSMLATYKQVYNGLGLRLRY